MTNPTRGLGRKLLRLWGEDGELHLLLFRDRTLAIRRNGSTEGLWDADDHPNCFRELARRTGMDARQSVVWVAAVVGKGLSKDRASARPERRGAAAFESLN